MDGQKNLAVYLHGPKDLQIREAAVVDPGPGEIQVQVKSVGICGTDIHYWASGKLFGEPLPEPMIMGHETSAVVLKCGPDVDRFKPGDRVHLKPLPVCHLCLCCQEGNEHNCQALKLGIKADGHMRRICNSKAEVVYKIPDHLSDDEGALIEPWVVGVYAVERARIQPGQKVAIIGAGAIGALTYIAAKAAGATKICVVDVNPAKLEMITALGGQETVTVVASKDARQTAADIEKALGSKPHSSLDCSCTQPGITTAIYATAPCGRVVLAGLAPDCSLPTMYMSINEIDLISCVRFGTCYPRALEMMASGQVKLAPLVAARYPLEKAPDAFQAVANGLKTGFKVIIDCTQ